MECLELEVKFPITKDPNRSKGLHLSDIYTAIAEELFPKEFGKPLTNPMWAELGFAWEKHMESKLPDVVRPGEIVLDGITMSPDGVDSGGVLHEYKLTWKSLKTTPKDRWKWLTQTKGYCSGLGVQICVFHILHVNGDYKNFEPVIKEYMVYYTVQELYENWQMLLNYAKARGWIR